MGYNQSFSLYMRCDKEHPEDQENFINALIEYSKDSNGKPNFEVEELIKNGGYYFGHLYGLEDWISDIAPKFPRLLIVLNGSPEDADPEWEHRWKGNEDELQYATIPEFENLNLRD